MKSCYLVWLCMGGMHVVGFDERGIFYRLNADGKLALIVTVLFACHCC